MKFLEAHIGLLSEGDKKAFLLLYENYFVSLCLFIRSFGLSKEESEDIVQEVFCKLNKNYSLPGNLNAFRSYLYTSAKNKCLNLIRDKKRRKNYEETFYSLQDELLIFDKIVENELYRQMHLFISEMPFQCRNIFRRALNGDTSEKIALDLNLSVETVKTQRKKAKKILKERYLLLYRTYFTFL
jgi:RNA polymerase sigma-70 factor (ECF subfamily)